MVVSLGLWGPPDDFTNSTEACYRERKIDRVNQACSNDIVAHFEMCARRYAGPAFFSRMRRRIVKIFARTTIKAGIRLCRQWSKDARLGERRPDASESSVSQGTEPLTPVILTAESSLEKRTITQVQISA